MIKRIKYKDPRQVIEVVERRQENNNYHNSHQYGDPQKIKRDDFGDEQRRLSFYKKELNKKSTSAEIEFARKLRALNIKYMFQKGFIKGLFCIADFYIPSLRLIIEIDGGYHNTSKQQFRDSKKDAFYKSRQFRILRIKNEKVFELSLEEFSKVLYGAGSISYG